LGGNRITIISDGSFAGLVHLKNLYLENNRISVISDGTLTGLIQLNFLDIRANQITDIEDGAFAELSQLSGLIKLKYLYLGGNNITVIEHGTSAGLTKLQSLDFQSNNSEISKVTFTGLSQLLVRDLGDNNIAVIGDGAFAALSNLRVLNLTANEITVTSENAFKDVKYGLSRLDFSNNKLVYNCSMQWFHAWFVDRREIFVGDDDLYSCSNLYDTNMQTWVVSQKECLFHDPKHFVFLFVASLMLLIGLLSALACLKKSVVLTAALVCLKNSACRLARHLLIPLVCIKNWV
jgi:netrin-G2